MTWLVTIKPSYQTDFIELPKDLQKQVAQAIHDISADPVTSRGNTIKPLNG